MRTDIAPNINTHTQLQEQIGQKQNIITARLPLKIQDDVISLTILSTQDAEPAASERALHLLATNQTTASIT